MISMMSQPRQPSRRQFLRNASAATASLVISSHSTTPALAKPVDYSELDSDDYLTGLWERGVTSHTGICCLIGDSDSPIMWAHYASSHRGVCCQFRMTPAHWAAFSLPLPVDYSDERPVVSLREMMLARILEMQAGRHAPSIARALL